MSGEGNEMRKSIIVVGVGRPAFASIVSSRQNARRLAACIPGSELFFSASCRLSIPRTWPGTIFLSRAFSLSPVPPLLSELVPPHHRLDGKRCFIFVLRGIFRVVRREDFPFDKKVDQLPDWHAFVDADWLFD